MAFLIPFLQGLLWALEFIEWLILVWVILSWILFFSRQSKVRWRYPKLFRVLEQLDDILTRMTRPFLRPFRKLLRRFDTAGIDWSPLLLLLTIFIIRGLVAIAYGQIAASSGGILTR